MKSIRKVSAKLMGKYKYPLTESITPVFVWEGCWRWLSCLRVGRSLAVCDV